MAVRGCSWLVWDLQDFGRVTFYRKAQILGNTGSAVAGDKNEKHMGPVGKREANGDEWKYAPTPSCDARKLLGSAPSTDEYIKQTTGRL